MKTLIIGRTSTGKDTLKDILEKSYGWKFVKSYTTRPRRNKDEDTHIFISADEASKVTQDQKAAWTQIGDYEYFATKEQITTCDGYIIDPLGAETLLSNMPDETFRIVYMRPIDTETQMDMAISRSDVPEKEEAIFKKRCQDEDEQFSRFEKMIDDGVIIYQNCSHIIPFVNTYEETDIENLAIQLECSRRFDINVRPFIDDLIKAEIMHHDENGQPMLIGADGKPRPIKIDTLTSYLEHNTDMLGDMMRTWLQLPTEDRHCS